MCVGMLRLRLRIISTKARAVALLQARVLGELTCDRRLGAALVVVRRMHLERRVQPQDAAEQAVVERFRIAGRQIGAAGAAEQQRIAGEQVIFHLQTHRVARVARRVHHLQTQAADMNHVAVIEAHVDERRGTFAMHHHGHAELLRQLPCPGKVVGVRVRIDQVTDAQPVARGEAKIAVNLARLRIDHYGRACLAAAEQIGLTTAGSNLLEDHQRASAVARLRVTAKAGGFASVW